MKLLIVAVVAATPGLFAQARGGARTVASPVRRSPQAPAPPVRAVAPPVAPRAAPIYFLGYYPNPFYYGDSAYGYAPAAPAADAAPYYGSGPGAPAYPSVIVNPNYVPDTSNPVLRDYSYLPATEGDPNADANPPAPVVFLIAMKDHTIYPAIAYWVENDTLNYITQQGVRNRVSLALVDRDFSAQLNKERSIDFALPEIKEN